MNIEGELTTFTGNVSVGGLNANAHQNVRCGGDGSVMAGNVIYRGANAAGRGAVYCASLDQAMIAGNWISNDIGAGIFHIQMSTSFRVGVVGNILDQHDAPNPASAQYGVAVESGGVGGDLADIETNLFSGFSNIHLEQGLMN